MTGKEEQAAALDARISELEQVIAQTEAVILDPHAHPARVAAAERYLQGARSTLSSVQAQRAALDK
jgi:hypothetical protein